MARLPARLEEVRADAPDHAARAAAFARVMAEHGDALARLAASYEWDPSERQDLLQEVALAVWLALPRFRGECSERTFVFRIAHNRALTHRFRRRHRSTPLDAIPEPADPAEGPDVETVRRQQGERLARAVRRLPERFRAAVVLTLEGLSNREVADVLGTTENNVAVRLTRARKQLRAMLDEPGERP